MSISILYRSPVSGAWCVHSSDYPSVQYARLHIGWLWRSGVHDRRDLRISIKAK